MTENLWAPWRMDYILANKEGSCVFCDHTGAQDNLILTKEAHAFVCLNKYPFAAGHLLVVPNKHVSDLGALDETESDAFFRLVRKAVARLRKAVSPEGINVGINLGKAAGAGIAEHLHAHVVPRWNGDTSFMPVLADVRVMPEYLERTRERLLPSFTDP
jgi:ATP adenylyltransferase